MRKIIYTAIVLAALLISAFVYVQSPSGYALATTLANKTGLNSKYMCVFAPSSSINFDTLDFETMQAWNKSLKYVVNPQNLSVVKTDTGSSMRQRFTPSEKGSERVIAVHSVEARTTYELNQRVFFEEGFDWGASSRSGKFGFGFGGGSAPSGGKLDKDGFTARLAWRGHDDGTANATLYLYNADRSQNIPYGDEIEIPNFKIPIGTWFNITLRIIMNSEHQLANGGISVKINDELLLEHRNIQWQSEGDQPVIDRLTFSSFHGGNSTEWSPSETVYAQFADICLYD